MPNASSENHVLRLRSGRSLGYAIFGDPNGQPVLYFTGGNSSRFEGRWFDERARQLGVLLIVPDRPGFGLSDFQPNRNLLDWPDVVNELVDALSIAEYSVFGLSGGGPHVASVVHSSPARVVRAAIVSGLAPPEMPRRYAGMWLPIRLLFFAAKYTPAISRLALKQMGSFYANPTQMKKRMVQSLPPPDRELIEARPQIIDIFSAAAQEAHRNGIEGDAWEWQLYVRPWGFKLSKLNRPIALWYGEFDKNVPVGMGHFLSERIPQSKLNLVQDGGHLSTINNYIDEIFQYLLNSVSNGREAA